MQQYVSVFVFVVILLFVIILYNQLKIMKKISKIEKSDLSFDENNTVQKDDINEQNPLVAAAIIAAINQHKRKEG